MHEHRPPDDSRGNYGDKRGRPYGTPSRRGRVNSALDKKQQRQALAASRAVLKVEGIPVDLARRFRPLAPELIERITDQIQQEVMAFAGPKDGRRRHLIHLAVEGAVTHFLDVVENKPSSAAGVHELFRRMGYAEAIDANDLDSIRAAYHIATRDSWSAVRDFVRQADLPPDILTIVVDAIMTYIDQLIAQVTMGYLTALQGMERPVQESRRRLMAKLLSGQPVDSLGPYCEQSRWTPPAELSVLTAALEWPAHVPTLPRYGPDVLIGLRHQRLTMVGGFEEIQTLASELLVLSGIEQVAVSWPVPIEEVSDAYRWTSRALDLVCMGLIGSDGVIYCSEHREILWLYADLSLSRRACEDLLAPLAGETPSHRLRLAETMLLWLQTRDSAPHLADRMHVHCQTVRHRLRRLKVLFGDQLTDPHRTLALMSALELTIPSWRASLPSPRKKKRKTDDKDDDS